MAYEFRVSHQTRLDIQEVLAWTYANFGEHQYKRYAGLIKQAMESIKADPTKLPAKERPEIHENARTFHIARKGLRASHFFLFRVKDDHIIVDRFLHHSMELSNHLPPPYES